MSAAAPVPRALPAEEMREAVDAGRCLLLVIDFQVDFAAPHGAMGRIGLDLAQVEPAIDRARLLIDAARAAGVAVGFARVVTRPDTDSAALKLFHRRTGRDEAALAICRAGTEGAAFWGVAPGPGELSLEKPLYSCFHGTGLAGFVTGRGIDTLVLAGMTTECCVDSTARDAFHRGLNVFVVADACAAYDPDEHAWALRALGGSCAVPVHSEAVLDAWGG